MELLRAENLTQSFDYPLFSNLNFTLNSKESVVIQGSSGCGKSTLLHILATLLKPNSGKVFYKDKDLYSLKENQRNEIRRFKMGIIFQTHYLFKGFSALENVELSSVLSGNSLDENILKKLGIDMLLNQKVSKLSGGQQQRVSIARVLCKKPEIIFADEATGNLDFENAKNVIEILIDYVKTNNAALFFVTHDSKLASFCDRIYTLKNYGIC
ncbi:MULTISPECIES: ABC transporter ATP-binding protein [unclassified Campylobacter]|uniref:ABC transporter ATP-binding protein n=1 Tax=unclassified Campylobacter TaxID=2593542 RepID=UPI001237C1AC|nr:MULTISPECIES: ABC transporter ATP-binding protein [unclassified Campylobacter]KAA6226375.1 ABC transporter ATP-binding protein [Campylobacter sp. LR286c]KAA6226587.1 ABC transporter ATP-binding protein [Campylobacter sp. LR185c]KAA6226867.1 ABC transporter ATP-binding protein [Campylobacter sp. LR196d]KAA6230304.1 ABC transporter ATP-binding protein [Campylobacter sp. LR291e]KAA6233825.1 ABC transporter ATP-binding protein [Campylobacter sp. LR264d]